MKRFISILVAVMMVLTLLPVGRVMAEEDVAKETEQEGIEAPGESTIDGTTEEGKDGDGSGNIGDGGETPAPEKDEEEKNDPNTDPNTDSNKEAEKEAKKQLEAAKDSLTKKFEEAKKVKETDPYINATKEKKDAFDKAITVAENALKEAEEALKKEDVTAETLKEAENKLTKAATKLEEAQNALDEKEDPKPEDPKPEDKLAEAKNLAKVFIDDLESLSDEQKLSYKNKIDLANSKEEVDKIKQDAKDKNYELRLESSRTNLQEEIDFCEGKIATGQYKNATKEKMDAYKAALKAAELELLNPKATPNSLTTAANNLRLALNSLNINDSPVVPSDNYSARVPRAIRNTIANANAMMAHSLYGSASYSSRTNLENRLASLKSIANDFENGYYSRYWNGKYWNGYYGDEWYDYYDNGYYYRNGVPYTYSGFRAHFGYYPKYDMSDYYGRGYWNGKYRRGYYRDGWYDYYENGYYYRDGVPYTYNEFRREFGYYPSYAYGRGYWYDYDEDWDPYYGYQGRYGYYYGSSIRDAVERTVDAINAVAISANAPLMKVSYPSSSDYDGYYDYYPWYYDPYYYDGYYYDQNSSKVRELKKLIGEAEELAASRSDAQWAPYRSELTDAANYGRKAAKGRASVKGAIEELEKAIKKAKTDGMKLYIRRGYMMGVNGTEFNPSGTLTRAEMAQIIENLLEQSGDTVAFAPKNFNDVESGRWYKKAVNLVSSHNIMKGNPDGNFYPQKPVSIEELIVIAARLGGHTPQNGNVFGIEKHYWSVHYIQTAYVKGWIGMDKFNPSAPITRGQAVQILNRSLNFGVDKEFINKYGAQMNKFSDVTMSSPYYYDIVAATNTISYSQVPKSKTRIWRAFQTSNGWSSSKYSNGTYVKPYTGW